MRNLQEILEEAISETSDAFKAAMIVEAFIGYLINNGSTITVDPRNKEIILELRNTYTLAWPAGKETK